MLVQALTARAFSLRDVQTVFLIVMENHRWSSILGSTNCPYINNTLLPQASYCGQYYSPTNLHPTLPNYLWLIAGTNFGILDDLPPAVNAQDTTNHLGFFLDRAGISWKAYYEGLAGLTYPPTNTVPPYHIAFNPFLYFRNVLTNADYCRTHMRPYEELAADLTNHTVARFNIISPGLWYSMHDGGLLVGDRWLATEVPKIMASQAYQNKGAIFITWDEDDFVRPSGNLGMIVLSPLAKGGGYQSMLFYTHSSTLRTFQNIFGVYPFLGDAVHATDLSDLFCPINLAPATQGAEGTFALTVQNVVSNGTYLVQATADLSSKNWEIVCTNVPTATSFTFRDPAATNEPRRFYRVKQEP